MFLKRIELRGFKSFAEPVEIEFQRGINAIVGPNGSGKSNVVDAIRWVLGEQSMRNLRSSKLGDVIFNGSNLKKPLGMADVAITLDNSDGLLPMGFSEVCLVRRVFRSGESEFYMNKTPCRLKDIQELLMDTGIGKDGYSLISQGNIDEVLSCRPEERRSIIEEAAGIMRYRARKKEAEKRLEETMVNITRIDDIISEIQNQLTPLAIQKEKALEYQRLKQKCQQLDINIHLLELEKRERELRLVTVSMGENGVKSQQIKDELERLQKHISSAERELDITEIEHDAVQKEYYALESNFKELQKDLGRHKEDFVRLEGEISGWDKTLVELKAKTGLSLNNLNQSVLKLEKELKRINQLEVDIGEKEHSFRALSDSIEFKEDCLDGIKGNVIDVLNSVSEKRSVISSLIAGQGNFENRLKQIADELSQVGVANAKTEQEINDIRTDTLRLQDDYQKQSGKLNMLDKTINEKRDLLKNAEKSYDLIWQRLTDAVSKQRALEEIKEGFEGYQQGVKNLLTSIKNGSFRCPGIFGSVADLILVDKEYEVAIETSLGGALQNIICENEVDAKAGIEYLMKNNLGRVTFLPLNTVKCRKLSLGEKRLKLKKGCIGCADSLVTFEDKYSNAIVHLLGRVLIADTMDNAIELARESGFALKVVTIDGQVLNPGGSVTGGSQRKPGLILTRNRQILELRQEIQELQNQVSLAKEAKSELSLEITAIQTSFEEGKNLQFEIKSKVSSLEHQLNEKCVILEERRKRKESLDKEYCTITKDIEKTRDKIEEVNAQINEMDHENLDHQSKAKTLQQELIEEKSLKEKTIQEITNLKIDLASKGQEYAGIKQAIEHYQTNIDEFNMELKVLEGKRIDSINQKISREAAINVSLKELEVQRDSLSRHRQRSETLKGKKESLKQNIQASLVKNQLLIENQRKLENIVNELKIEVATLEIETKQIMERLFETYSLNLEQALAFKTDLGQRDEMKYRLEMYRSQVQSLGSVNLQAIEDYGNLKNRYDFLEAQKSDLVGAKGNLDTLIHDIIKIMEKMFLESFNTVKNEFAKVFSELFGGGIADLTITGGGDILESGIDIIAQPPGKKLQNLSLLSGGERTLTAIALLFSVLNTKVTPFCILDEIEATLDDANIDRFTRYLRKVSMHTQFIVVTHRKTTMEASHALYGISMENTAVSKVLSVKMEK